jgi:hypothetical protein
MSALLDAARVGILARVQQLIAGGADVMEREPHTGWTPLLCAAGYPEGDLDTVRWLLTKGGSNPLEAANYDHWTAILLAAAAGRLETVQWLLKEAWADVRDSDTQGRTALLRAAASGQFSVVQRLLEGGGACIKDASNIGLTVWMVLKIEEAIPYYGPIISIAERRSIAVELLSLLKVMVMLADAPGDFIAKLSPQHAELAMQGRRFRAQLPSYLKQASASVVVHCPLPAVLQDIVSEYAKTTPEDMWENGLRVWLPQAKRSWGEMMDEGNDGALSDQRQKRSVGDHR